MSTLSDRQDAMRRMHAKISVPMVREDFPAGKIIRFEARQVKILSRPMVYLFCRNECVLYVGMSRHGMVRVLHPHHHAAIARQRATETLLIPCESFEHACRLERRLILKYKPFYNSSLLGGQRETGLKTRRMRLELQREAGLIPEENDL